MHWLDKPVEQNLDEIFAIADTNARLRIIDSEKRADLSGMWNSVRDTTMPYLNQAGSAMQGLASQAGTSLQNVASQAQPYLTGAMDWAKQNPIPAASLGGAGVGALGGMAMNAMNPDEDERNLLGSAATGAVLGGGIGLGGSLLAQHVPNLLQTSDSPPAAKAMTDAIEQISANGPSLTSQAVGAAASPLGQAARDVGNLDPRALGSVPGAAAAYGGAGYAGYHGGKALLQRYGGEGVGKFVGLHDDPRALVHGARKTLDYAVPKNQTWTQWLGGMVGGKPELASSVGGGKGNLAETVRYLAGDNASDLRLQHLLNNANVGMSAAVKDHVNAAGQRIVDLSLNPRQVGSLSRAGISPFRGRLGKRLGLGALLGLGGLAGMRAVSATRPAEGQ